MPRSLLRYRHATPLLVLSLLIGLMSLPDVTNHLLGLMRPTASAATSFTVNSTGDGADSNLADGVCNDGTGACTLRAAIQQANGLAGDDTINFSLPANSIVTLNNVLDAINDNLIINGPGANTLTVQRSTAGGTPSFRIFTINSGKTVTISGLTISNGDANGFSNSGFGGGLFNNGTLTLSGCNFYGNSSLSVGGGIYNTGPSLILNNCNVGGTLPAQANTSGSNGAVSGLYHNNGTLLMSGGSIVGNSGGSGIGIGGVATLNGVVITNNIETKGVSGGGITVYNSASANIVNCVIANNSSASAGGGVYNGVGTVNLVNSTISGNTAFNRGAGIENFNANMTLTNVTVTNNRADTGDLGFRGGGLEEAGGIITLRNTLISGNFRGSSGTTADDISGTVSAASSFNLIGTGGAGGLSNTNGNQIGVVNALLAPLGNYGGPTPTHALLPGSPAIDLGSNANLPLDTFDLDGDGNTSEPIPFDQRGMGFNRAADGNGDGTTTVDIGAYEVQSILVTNTNDSGAGSLRQAITDADASPGNKAINFQSGLTGTISLLSALPDLSTSMSINGPGANQLTVQRSTVGGTPQFRIFSIQNSTITLTGLTISGGFHNGGGAGILANSGSTLNINGCVISGNTDNNFRGGGISSAGTLSLANSTVSGNTGSGIFTENGIIAITNTTLNNNVGSAIRHLSPFPFSISNSTISGNSGGLGGGIFMSGGVLTMSNTTVSGNTALEGGGFFTGGGTTGDTLLLNNCTITGNRGTAGGFFTAGGIQTSGSLTLKNSIVAGNFKDSGTTPGDISLVGGSIQSASSNLIGDANSSGGITHGVNGNQVGNGGSGTINIHTVLAVALANNGGPTLTHALLAGSPALDAGDNCVFDNTCLPPNGLSLTTDQRGTGFSRKVDGPDANTTATVDIGAFEAQVSVEAIANQTINEDSSLSLSFNLGGAASVTSVTASSSDSNLVPNNPSNISISGSGSTRTLLITPVANAFGTSNITVTVNGNNSQTMSDTFLLTVNSVNDAPSFIKGLDQTVNENDGAQTVNSWATSISAGPANEAGQGLTFITVTNTNLSLFAVAPAITSSGTLSYTPATGASGVATITIALMDNGGTANAGTDTSATQSFTINMLEGGTLAFSAATYSVNENGGPATITITRTGGTAGTATVLFSTSDGTATSADYTSVSQTVTFNDGDTSKTVNIPITNDSANEPDETINLTLSNVGGSGELGTPATAVLTIINDDTPGFQFEQSSYTVGETSGSVSIVVKRIGDPSIAATVDYSTNDASYAANDGVPAKCDTPSSIASSKCDYATAGGRLRFAAGETSKTVVLSIVDDIYVEGDETLSMTLSNQSTGNLVSPSTTVITIQSNDTNQNATGADNPYLNNAFFVRQQYLDFLLREPDTNGFNDWVGVLNNCQPNQGGLGSDPGCDRVHVTSGFFRSPEFGERGYWVYRFFSASLGRRPLYAEFTPEMRRLSGLKPQADLDKDEADFINEFMQRPEFTNIYNGITDAGHASAFISKLEEKAGVTLPETVPPTQAGQPPQYGRSQLIGLMQNGTLTPAQTLRAFVEQKTVWDAYFFKAFVAMEYFGYLRRDPENAGYDDWVDVLTNGRGTHPPGDFRHLVFGFIYSEEYRERFGPK